MFQLDIVTPEEKIFSDTVENVYLPANEGEMGILTMHDPVVTPLVPGELRYEKDGAQHELAIGEGFAEIAQDHVSVLTDLAVNEEHIDEAKVEAAMERARQALEKAEHQSEEDHAALQAVIAKSMAQLNLKRKSR